MKVLGDFDLNRKSDYVNKLFKFVCHYLFTLILLVIPRDGCVSSNKKDLILTCFSFLSYLGEERVDILFCAINQIASLTNRTKFVDDNTYDNQFIGFSQFYVKDKLV